MINVKGEPFSLGLVNPLNDKKKELHSYKCLRFSILFYTVIQLLPFLTV